MPVLENERTNYEYLVSVSKIDFIGSPGSRGRRHCGGAARPCIASHTREGVHGMSM